MIKSVKMAVIVLSLVLTGCAATVNKPSNNTAALISSETVTTYTVQPQASVRTVADSASVQTVAFRVGSSSVTVEKMAKKAGCVGGKGAGLITPKGAVEVYRMACDNGGNFVAKCEMRQCRAM